MIIKHAYLCTYERMHVYVYVWGERHGERGGKRGMAFSYAANLKEWQGLGTSLFDGLWSHSVLGNNQIKVTVWKER